MSPMVNNHYGQIMSDQICLNPLSVYLAGDDTVFTTTGRWMECLSEMELKLGAQPCGSTYTLDGLMQA